MNVRSKHLTVSAATLAAALGIASASLAADATAPGTGDVRPLGNDPLRSVEGLKPKWDADPSADKSGAGTGDTARPAPDIRENEPGAKPRRDAEVGQADGHRASRDERVSMIEGSKASGEGDERPLGNDPARSIEGLKPKWDADVKKGG